MFLMNDLAMDLVTGFYCSQWNTRDCATLTTITSTYKDYKEILIEAIDKLTRQSYLAKYQGQYLKTKNESPGKNEVLVMSDFAENYQFLR